MIMQSSQCKLSLLAELSSVAQEKRQPLEELTTPSTTQLSFGRTVPMAMPNSCPTVHFMKRSFRMKDVYIDHDPITTKYFTV